MGRVEQVTGGVLPVMATLRQWLLAPVLALRDDSHTQDRRTLVGSVCLPLMLLGCKQLIYNLHAYC